MIDRFLLSASITGALLLLGYALRFLWRSRVIAALRSGERGRSAGTSIPTLHYFWSESCAPCKVQEAAIHELQTVLAAEGRAVALSRHNAVTEADLARKMRIVTVPTTLLTGADGQVVAWNPGLIGAQALLGQIRRHFGSPSG
jgi:thioredoxin-like negative regulator of GroEL